MANQQPPSSRPWFRLASQIRMEQPPVPPPPSQQAPAPVATPPALPRPMFGRLQSLLPLNPQTTEPPPPQQPPAQGRPKAPSQPPAVSSTPPLTMPSRPLSPTPPQPSPQAPRSKAPMPGSPGVLMKPFAPATPESPRSALPPTPLRAQAIPELETKLPTTETVKARSVPTPTSPRSPPVTELPPTVEKKSPSSIPTFTPAPSPPASPHSKRFQEPLFKKHEEGKATVTESAATKSISAKKKMPSSSSEAPAKSFSMLTLAGDNTGAHMELWGKYRRSAKPFVGRFHQLKDDPNGAAATAEEKGKKKKAAVTAAGPMAALVNSNVQGANNSILFNSTCVHGSPGVHIFLSASNNRRRGKDAPYGSKTEGGNNGNGYR